MTILWTGDSILAHKSQLEQNRIDGKTSEKYFQEVDTESLNIEMSEKERDLRERKMNLDIRKNAQRHSGPVSALEI